MKRLDLGMLAVAFVSLVIATGCNNNSKQIDGEPLLVKESVITECDEKFEFKVTGPEDTNVTIEYKDTENNHFNMFGVDITYDIVTPCPEPECDINGTCEIQIPSNEGTCPDGYQLSGSTSQCFLISATCGEGTYYDNWTNTCEANDCEAGLPIEPQPPIPVCPVDTTLVGDTCLTDVYIPAFVPPDGYVDCINGYTWDKDNELCRLDVATIE